VDFSPRRSSASIEESRASLEDRLAAAAHGFAAAGLRSEAPHLGPGSQDAYDALVQ
jgi:hypothetical protein